MTVAALRPVSGMVPWDFAELHSFRLSALQTQGNFLCYDSLKMEVRCTAMPVYGLPV